MACLATSALPARKRVKIHDGCVERVEALKSVLAELDLSGRYLVADRSSALGHGGYGTVVSAHDTRSHTNVAIKHVRGDLVTKNVSEATRILREFRINYGLRDEPCFIVKLLDAMGTSSDGSVLFVFELGVCDVHKAVHSCSLSGSYPFDMTMLTYDVASALKIIHGRGVIHRDLKLSNLILREDRRISLADFGISGPIGTCGAPMTGYIQSRGQRAPELLFKRLKRERRRLSCDPKSRRLLSRVDSYLSTRLDPKVLVLPDGNYTESIDIWSFGCILAELILGESPFQQDYNITVLAKIVWLLGDESKKPCRLRRQLEESLVGETDRDTKHLVQLILWMLSIDHTRRPTATQVVEFILEKWPMAEQFSEGAVKDDIASNIQMSSIPSSLAEVLAALKKECTFFHNGNPIN